jgi:CheY-like chemotaxis protein
MQQNLPSEKKEWFEENLKTLLQSLYDPAVLRICPLTAFLGAARRGDTVSILRDALLEGIEALKPGHNTPRDSRTWRIYTILRRRYVEQISQEIVAKDMGLSVRQLQREERIARQVLADHLWTRNNLDGRLNEIEPFMRKREAASLEKIDPVHNQEIEWLRESTAYQNTDITLFIQDVLATAGPILRLNQVDIRQHPPVEELRASLPASIVRQALLNILAVLSKTFPGGTITIQPSVLPKQLSICLDCHPPVAETTGKIQPALEKEQLLQQYEGAVPLVAVCEGTLSVTPLVEEPGWRTQMEIPLQRQIPVLVIDDNADALTLIERYFAGSSYRFYGERDAHLALALVEDIHPEAIMLDVMMPDQDGWTILGQLREHPSTSAIPVIICTILAQRDLALALGAADFLKKPINRPTLLAALDRLLASQPKATG